MQSNRNNFGYCERYRQSRGQAGVIRRNNPSRNQGSWRNDGESAGSTGQSSTKNNESWRNRSNSRDSNRSQFNRPNRNERNETGENSTKTDRPTTEYKNRESRPMGFGLMEDLLKNDDVEDVIFQLKSERKGFLKLLEKPDLTNDQIILIVQLLNKVCDSSFSTNVVSLLEKALKGAFAETIVTYITKLPMQDEKTKRANKYFWKEPDKFWTNLLKISHKLHNLTPTSFCEILKKILHALKVYIPVIENLHSIHISDEIKNNINVLHELIEETLQEMDKKKIRKPIWGTFDDDDEEPPDDYRDINVYPNIVEITTQKKPFLRRNVVYKPYETIYHYLDVQFRLLREDFVRPLRIGICKYMSDPKAKLDDIKIYKQVQFLNAEVVNDQNCYRLQFDTSTKKRQINYENSRRFMFGSLLCFTSDNFRTILFGKVVKRDMKDLDKRQIVVGFDNDIVLPELYNKFFLMVESSVYFEPYYQVLNVLKNIEPVNFPMERYIIRVETDPRPPEYLLQNQTTLRIESQRFDPLNWGNRTFYGLNESQQAAFKAALTQEFAVIQGPPGTGKTFLGLKIAQTLIRNYNIWYNKSPILVICFTNHALDQFLEGILDFTTEIIRIGGQSKNEKLNKYNIRNIHKSNPIQSYDSVYEARRDVRSYIEEIEAVNTILTLIENNDSIMEFSMFSKYVKDYQSSYFAGVPSGEIYSWLFSEYDTNNMLPFEKMNLEEINEREIDGSKNEEIEDYREIDDVFNFTWIQSYKPLVSIKSLKEQIIVKQRELQYLLDSTDVDYREKRFQERVVTNELHKIQFDLECLQRRLQEYAKNPHRKPQFIDLEKPYNMDPDSRWQLYFYWLNICVKKLKTKKEGISKVFQRVYKVYSEMRDMEDAQLMREALVIGMTTTGAARLHSSLQALKSPIVIVEEAAEVLEAHIISALTVHCKHLILIGDHQQLKPSTANFKLETEYLLGISWFERMVSNKIQCHTLNVQHRMRPEISSLIHPVIYRELYDHDSVKDRPPIHGIEKCLYFIDHQQPEELCSDNSKKNVHEAKFLINFARHLILNDYKPENIVILAAYLGQMFEMQRLKKMDKILLQDIRIAVLDNYQGEESDIILLSLVRNNSEKKIGFLKIDNRVCVALSRARNGFYIMGNMEQLCESSEIWTQIRDVLKGQDAIGPYLSLRCQVHQYKIAQVKDPEDFNNFPEGGCDLKCYELLNCGHYCKSFCHVRNRDHANYKCKEKCTKLLCEDPTHVCRRLCFEECGHCVYPVERRLDCGHTVTIECYINPDEYDCKIPVHTVLPCGHETDKPCYEDPEVFRCPDPCENRIEPCGHACIRSCHIRDDPDHLEYKCPKQCEKHRRGCTSTHLDTHMCRKACFEDCEECEIFVYKKRTVCSHIYNIACKLNVDDIECKKPCTKILPCEHKCKNHCCDICGNCQEMVEKIVPGCNHKIKIQCREEPTRYACHEKCPRLLPCGHVCGKKCSEECRTRCTTSIACDIPGPCGHIVKQIPCYLKNTDDTEKLLKYCNEKCEVNLKCDHKCSGTCGECSQGRIHKRCMEECKVPLICNHECPIPCRQACQPCQKKCTYKCGHSKCPKNCGDPCINCTEKCTRRCRHQQCTKKCSEMCNVAPCNKPCEKRIKKCGHKCVGFCGEICPILCRICDKEELTEIFFGTEDEENATFVMLEDCKHIFESTSLDQYFSQQNEGEITVKVCPKCKTTVRNSHRYSEYIKLMLKDITAVKRKSYGFTNENEQLRLSLIEDIRLCENMAIKLRNIFDLKSILNTLNIRLSLAKIKKNEPTRRQGIHKMNLMAIKAKIQVVQTICDSFKAALPITQGYKRSAKIVTLILDTLLREVDSITDQEIEDIYNEIKRLTRVIQFERIQQSPTFTYINGMDDVNIKVARIETLLGTKKSYTVELDNTIKRELEELNVLTKSKIVITDAERRQVVAALKLKPGHWFKCANGHPYVITECGGAMEVSKCNECGVPIGGYNHQLLYGRPAPEIDGARYPAWSEQANMANYRF